MSLTTSTSTSVPTIPFDAAKLDALLQSAGVDAILATSPHNVRYLLGGYSFFLYERLDSIGPSRYLPVVGYIAGRPSDAFYVGAGNEAWGTDANPIWASSLHNVAWTARGAAEVAAEVMDERGLARATIGVEPAYLPAEAMDALRGCLPSAAIVDVTNLLEELRAVKSVAELDLLRAGARAVVDAMLATFAVTEPAMATSDVVERLRLEETRRGLTFAYCLVAAGSSHARAPSGRRIAAGDVLSLDSGASHRGYTADLTRMGIAGKPTARHREALAQIDAVQQAARAAVSPGRRGGDIFAVAEETMAGLPHRDRMSFLAHGTGLLTHEAPRLTDKGSPPYPATHRDRPLEPGMVLSVETHLADPIIGFIKLEDTVIVTPSGHEGVGDHGRGWNPLGA